MPGMTSAMSAVAVRRERKRSKTGLKGHLSRAGSASSFQGRHRLSVSTLDHVPHRIAFKTQEQEQREKLLMYMGTLLLVTGLFLLFIGVGVGVTTTRKIGLLFIGIGGFLCFLKVMITPDDHEAKLVRKPRRLETASTESLYHLAIPGSAIPPTVVEEEPQIPERNDASEHRDVHHVSIAIPPRATEEDLKEVTTSTTTVDPKAVACSLTSATHENGSHSTSTTTESPHRTTLRMTNTSVCTQGVLTRKEYGGYLGTPKHSSNNVPNEKALPRF